MGKFIMNWRLVFCDSFCVDSYPCKKKMCVLLLRYIHQRPVSLIMMLIWYIYIYIYLYSIDKYLTKKTPFLGISFLFAAKYIVTSVPTFPEVTSKVDATSCKVGKDWCSMRQGQVAPDQIDQRPTCKNVGGSKKKHVNDERHTQHYSKLKKKTRWQKKVATDLILNDFFEEFRFKQPGILRSLVGFLLSWCHVRIHAKNILSLSSGCPPPARHRTTAGGFCFGAPRWAKKRRFVPKLEWQKKLPAWGNVEIVCFPPSVPFKKTLH